MYTAEIRTLCERDKGGKKEGRREGGREEIWDEGEIKRGREGGNNVGRRRKKEESTRKER